MDFMKICGIICEYNPFHNGHLKQIDYLKGTMNCDYVVIAMSGNFSQRALPCVLDKYKRAEFLDKVDLVCQIPTAYNINNGEVFALAGVKTLIQAGANCICFGVETVNENLFFSLRDKMLNENDIYKANLNKYLCSGMSFKQANILSVKESFEDGEAYCELLSKPNNILALEYLKAIKKLNCNFEIIFLKREDNFSDNFHSSENISSATTIRNYLSKGISIDNFTTKKVIKTLQNYYKNNYVENYKHIAFNVLLAYDIDKMRNTYLVSEGLENRILEMLQKSSDFDELVENICTKRYDKNKIYRVILNYVLGVSKDIIKKLYDDNTFNCVKVLAFNPEILKDIKGINLIIRKYDITEKCFDELTQIENNSNLLASKIFNCEIPYNDIYIKALKI